jgi:peptidoglycan/LPS O-acetylase OafA/YrhL
MLTSLRFFAALNVVFFHLAPRCSNSFLRGVTSSGPEMVEFFFVLSGFILAYIYLDDESPGSMAAKRVDFWTARLARILPAYGLGLLLLAPIFFYTGLVSRIVPLGTFLPGVVLVPLMLQAWWPPAALLWNVPAWSLSVEVFFYAVFPALICVCPRGRGMQTLALAFAMLVAGAMVRAGLAASLPPSQFLNHFLWYFPLLHLPHFMFGLALGRLFLDVPKSRLLSRPGVFLWGGGVSAVMLLGLRSWLPAWAISPPVMSIIFGTVIVVQLHRRPTGDCSARLCLSCWGTPATPFTSCTCRLDSGGKCMLAGWGRRVTGSCSEGLWLLPWACLSPVSCGSRLP